MNSQQLQGEIHNNDSERTISLILLILIIAVGIYFFIPLPFFRSSSESMHVGRSNGSYSGSREKDAAGDIDENSKRVLENDFYVTETNVDPDDSSGYHSDNILSGVQDIRSTPVDDFDQ